MGQLTGQEGMCPRSRDVPWKSSILGCVFKLEILALLIVFKHRAFRMEPTLDLYFGYP